MSLKQVRPKCVTLPAGSTDPYISGRIIISYYGSTTRRSFKYVNKLYCKHGRSVVLMCNSRAVPARTTLRAMLTALALYPKFLQHVPSVRSSRILLGWATRFCKANEKKYTNVPLQTLLKLACLSMASIESSLCGARFTLITSQNVRDILINLHMLVCSLTGSLIQQGKLSPIALEALLRSQKKFVPARITSVIKNLRSLILPREK